uniref:Casein kinase I-like isoform X3 n=2 Tax=Rhizophora mucronata TaxID=61149 RepID=A0A2P2M903_RHIMU
MALQKSIGIFKHTSIYHTGKTRILQAQLAMQVLIPILELSKVEEMIWSHLAMCSCIFSEEGQTLN